MTVQATVRVRSAQAVTATQRSPHAEIVMARQPEAPLVRCKTTAAGLGTERTPRAFTASQRLPASLTASCKQATEATVTERAPRGFVSEFPTIPDFLPNIVFITADDVGSLSYELYDSDNLWPASYPYPSTPWLDSLAAKGITYTQCRVSARCTPTRAQLETGRYCFRNNRHTGTGLGDVQNTITPSFTHNLSRDEYPLAYVARKAGTVHQLAHFDKWHMRDEERAAGAGPEIDVSTQPALDYWGGPCIDGAWPYAVGSNLYFQGSFHGGPNMGTNTGDGGWGWFFYDKLIFTLDDVDDTVPVHVRTDTYFDTDDKFQPNATLELIDEWMDTLDADLPFCFRWHTHIPHSVLYPVPPDSGPGGATIHSWTEVELVPGATTADGKVDNEDPSGGYDGDGNQSPDYADGPPWPSQYRYTSEGRVNLLWRRHQAYLEALDYYCQALQDKIESKFSTAKREQTIFIFLGDNGSSGADFTPLRDDKYTGLGFDVLPPTGDNTESGTPYHDPNHMKGNPYDNGVRVPLVIGGDLLDATIKGTTRDDLIDAVDLYPTVLDVIAPGWSGYLSGEGALGEIDGKSLFPHLLNVNAGPVRSYGLSEVFGPPDVHVDDEQKRLISFVNTDGWKLIQRYSDGSAEVGGGAIARVSELYDLNTDPDEQTDLHDQASDILGHGTPERAQLEDLTDALYDLRYPHLTKPFYPSPS